MSINKKDIIDNLRAIIISSKGGLKLSDVKADYKETFGCEIPLSALGCSSLEDFFMENPNNFAIHGSWVHAVVKPSSFHIVSLVNRQNSKKRGRPKLFSKQPRNLRKPLKSFSDETHNRHYRKSLYNEPPKLSRQNSNKNSNLSSALKQMQEIQKVAYNKKMVQKNVQNNDKITDKKNRDIQAQVADLDKLKELKRTVINSPSTCARDSSSAIYKRKNKEEVSEEEKIPFKDFEDLHVSDKPQSLLLKTKTFSDLKHRVSFTEPVEKTEPNWGSPPASPFRRSLAINTQEEILFAKKSAQIRLDNNNVSSSLAEKKESEFTVDLIDETQYEHTLKQFCLEKGLILPTYSVIVREPLNQPKRYGCMLMIGDAFQVSTHPVETHSYQAARELVSKKAIELLNVNNNLSASFFETEYVIKLRALCSEKGLPEPIFKSIECRPKNELGYFICKVRIGDEILLSSYPEEVQNEFSARDLAAKKAFDFIHSVKKTPSGISKNDNETLSRIFNLVKEKEYGVWSNKLPVLYLDSYNEELLPGWFELVKNNSKFEITHIEKAGYIIRAKTEEQTLDNTTEFPTLASLKTPESNQWEVYITNVVSSTEIWCRLIGKDYSELYDSMMTKLELQPPTENIKNPVVGDIYLVNFEESWNRVKVTQILPNDEVSVFLIDVGVNEIVKLTQLFHLQKNFFVIPPQAILLSLNELECLADCEDLQSALFHCLLGNTFIAEIIAILNEGGNVSSVNLWDTSTDEDINVNLKLIDEVIKTIKSPQLPSVGSVREMYVSHVDDSSDIYLQSSKKNAEYVNWIISIKLKNCGKLVPISKIDPEILYVTWSNKKGLYCRAKLSRTIDAKSVIVKFIDLGYEQPVLVEDLYDLEQTQIDLATIPSQVIRTKFNNLKSVNSKVLAKIREYVSEQSVLVKVIQISSGIPSVDLFKRSRSDGTLSSVNNKIAEDAELFIVDAPIRKKSHVVGLESTLSKDLPMPNIPPIGSYFSVIVTLAAHPGLFNVQPLSTQNELMELMFRLQEKCKTTCSKPLTEEEFKIGELYAVKHVDDYWYRAYAHAVVSASAFTVCLCDFGDFIIVPAEKLMPLSSEFKTFPYQAIRAYLTGIVPVDADWSPLDCVNFREMVVEKQFMSQVIEIKKDSNNPNYITLGLTLVDTTTSEDIYIHKVLVDKKMAMLKN